MKWIRYYTYPFTKNMIKQIPKRSEEDITEKNQINQGYLFHMSHFKFYLQEIRPLTTFFLIFLLKSLLHF